MALQPTVKILDINFFLSMI